MGASTNLTTLESVKRYMHIGDDAHDESLTALIGAVSEAIERVLDRPFALAERTERYDGGGTDLLTLRVRPVVSVAEVYDDPAYQFIAATLLAPSSYTVYDEEGLLALVAGHRFHPGRRNIKVVYTAGYDPVPPAIEQAANILVSSFHTRGAQGADGVASENVGSYVVSYDTADWPHQARALLKDWRELRI